MSDVEVASVDEAELLSPGRELDETVRVEVEVGPFWSVAT